MPRRICNGNMVCVAIDERDVTEWTLYQERQAEARAAYRAIFNDLGAPLPTVIPITPAARRAMKDMSDLEAQGWMVLVVGVTLCGSVVTIRRNEPEEPRAITCMECLSEGRQKEV